MSEYVDRRRPTSNIVGKCRSAVSRRRNLSIVVGSETWLVKKFTIFMSLVAQKIIIANATVAYLRTDPTASTKPLLRVCEDLKA